MENKYLKKFEKLKTKILKGNYDFFSLCHPQATHESPQKNLVHLVQMFGLLLGTYLRRKLSLISSLKQNIKYLVFKDDV